MDRLIEREMSIPIDYRLLWHIRVGVVVETCFCEYLESRRSKILETNKTNQMLSAAESQVADSSNNKSSSQIPPTLNISLSRTPDREVAPSCLFLMKTER